MSHLGDPRPLPLKTGTHYSLEEQADRLLAQGREGVTALSDKRDYLTSDQLALRASKEILNSQGFPDAALVSGLFRRAYNPLTGNRPRSRHHHQEE